MKITINLAPRKTKWWQRVFKQAAAAFRSGLKFWPQVLFMRTSAFMKRKWSSSEFLRFKIAIRWALWWRMERFFTARLLEQWTNRLQRTQTIWHPLGVQIKVRAKKGSRSLRHRSASMLQRISRQIRVRAKWSWRKARRAGGMRPVIQAAVLIALFIALAWWSDEAARNLVAEARRIPMQYVWWGLGGLLGLLFLIWLLRVGKTAYVDGSSRARSYGWLKPILKWTAGLAAAALLLFWAGPSVIAWLDDDPDLLVVRRECSRVRVPLGQQIQWEREGELAAYEAINQLGDTISYPRGPVSEYRGFSGRLTEVCFRVPPEEGVDSVLLRVVIAPIG